MHTDVFLSYLNAVIASLWSRGAYIFPYIHWLRICEMDPMKVRNGVNEIAQ